MKAASVKIERELSEFLARFDAAQRAVVCSKIKRMGVHLARDNGGSPEMRAGSWMGGDCWLKIGLSRAEVKLITRAAKGYKFEAQPTANMARRLLMMALLNLPKLEDDWRARYKYCQAEGIDLADYCEHQAKAALAQARG